MCAHANPSAASVTPLASSGRSFFSRLTSPLKSRTRNLHDFHIKPHEPYKKYSPGDLVKGAVILEVVKPIRITHLTVCLHGFVRVFKNPNGANQPLPDLGLTASSNPRRTQYFGNGHCSLFQDEQTLCGEGRLDAGVYEFNFELEFPEKGVPTSIDFERGTISYMITATITRPTSITPTSSCDTKISLVESVDIGPMAPPKPRTISLEPISRRTKRKKTATGKNKESESQETTDTGSGSEAARMTGSPLPDESASQCGSMDHHATPRSPVPSEMQSTVSTPTSAESTVSSSTGVSFRLGPVPSSARSARHSHNSGSKVSLADQTITASIELLKSGCLPGDNLPVKITIKHAKAIKSMHGIIITLYRQGRIDSAPPLYLFGDIKGKEAERLKHEEYYPKSKTGLGGLSLSSAGSSSIFRKDLAQTFAPILVDPITLTAVVNASVRVPEDVFPTIKGVPGEMISFKYHVEVVLDLGGKLAGQQRHVPGVGAVTGPPQTSGFRGEGGSNMLAAWGGSIVDTANIRREKSVVACLFDLVVGTKDSARVRGRANSSRSRIADWSQEAALPAAVHEPIYEESVAQSNHHDHDEEQPYPYYEQSYDPRYQEYYNEEYEYQDVYPDHQPPPAHAHIPPPEIAEEQGLTEKERARRAEERLLPSQPPMHLAGPSSSTPMPGPSRPPYEPEEDIYSADNNLAAGSNGLHPLNQVSSERTISPSAPALEDLHPGAALQPTEDKQELERRRLMAETSAPSFPNEDDNAGEGSSGAQLAPSAPPLVEDGFGGSYEHLPGPSRRDTLPMYER